MDSCYASSESSVSYAAIFKCSITAVPKRREETIKSNYQESTRFLWSQQPLTKHNLRSLGKQLEPNKHGSATSYHVLAPSFSVQQQHHGACRAIIAIESSPPEVVIDGAFVPYHLHHNLYLAVSSRLGDVEARWICLSARVCKAPKSRAEVFQKVGSQGTE